MHCIVIMMLYCDCRQSVDETDARPWHAKGSQQPVEVDLFPTRENELSVHRFSVYLCILLCVFICSGQRMKTTLKRLCNSVLSTLHRQHAFRAANTMC